VAKHWIDGWNPEDDSFWQRAGRRIARRNLVFSIFSEHLGFSVWLMWCAVVVMLPKTGQALD